MMPLWAFLIRVSICVCQMLSVERQRLAPVSQSPVSSPSPSLSSSPSAMPPNGPQRLLLSMSLRYQWGTVEPNARDCECSQTHTRTRARNCDSDSHSDSDSECDCALHLE